MAELGLSDAGLSVPRTSDFITTIRESFVSDSGIDIDWESDLVLGILTAIMAQQLGSVSEALQGVYDAFDLNGATGVQLSNLAQLVGVNRKAATHAQATVTLTADPYTVLTVGRLMEGGGANGRARWQLIADVTVPAAGEIDVVVEAVEAGRTVALPGEIDQIVTPVPGWTAVTNAEAASPGLDAETDAELRIRRAQSIQLSAGLSIAAMRARVLNLEFIEACAVIDNPDNEDKTIEGIPLLAHSYLVIVLPDTLTSEQQQDVLLAIYESTPVSTTHSATDVVGTVTGADGFDKEVGFDYAVEVPANITGTLTMATGYSVADASPVFRELVEAFIATLQIGDPLTGLKLCAFADQVPGVLGLDAEINGGDDLFATAVERVVVGTWGIH